VAVQDPQRVHQTAAAVVHRHVGATPRDVNPWIVTDLGQHVGDRREVVSVADVHLDHVVPGAGLQVRGRTGGDHFAVVDDDDVRGEPVGFVEVLGCQQDVRAGDDQAPDRVP